MNFAGVPVQYPDDRAAPAWEPGQVYAMPLVSLFAGDSSSDLFFSFCCLWISSNRNGSPRAFGRLKEYAFHQGSIVVLLSWWCDERGQGGQLARDSAGIINKQVKVSRLEPRNALSSLAVICPPGMWDCSQDYCCLWFLSPPRLLWMPSHWTLFQVREISTNDFNPLFGWFLLGPEPYSSGSLVPDGWCVKRQEFTC